MTVEESERCGKGGTSSPLVPASCQVCGEALAGRSVVLCHRCKTPHHGECWRYNRGCAVYGCGCRTSETPSPADGEGEGSFTVDAPPSMATFAMLLTASILGFVGGMAAIAITPWALAFAIPWYVITLTGSILYQSKGRFRLVFDGERGTAKRRFICMGRGFGEEKDWLRADDVAEVHLHRYTQNQYLRMQELWVALVDGRRELVSKMRIMQGSEWDAKMEEQAEAIAAWADTTVRFLETDEAPGAAEIREAAEQKLLDREELRKALPED